MSRLALGHTQPPLQWIMRVKWAEHEADHTTPPRQLYLLTFTFFNRGLLGLDLINGKTKSVTKLYSYANIFFSSQYKLYDSKSVADKGK
jgi:hypothetical protein